MTSTKRLLAVAAVAGATAFTSFSSDAFFGPFSWMRGGGWGPGWWGGPGVAGAIHTMAGVIRMTAGVTRMVAGDTRIGAIRLLLPQ